MIWKDGYPKPNGASDWEDSSHLAGMLAVIGHEEAPDLRQYIFKTESGPLRYIYKRCPNSQYDFSRDQLIPLWCGMRKKNQRLLMDKSYVTGKDLLPPSVLGLLEYGEPTLLQRLWLRAEILFHAYCNPLGEPNQIIALCSVYGPEYMRLWTKHNKKWKESIRAYFSGWRGEPELSDRIIDFVNKEIA